MPVRKKSFFLLGPLVVARWYRRDSNEDGEAACLPKVKLTKRERKYRRPFPVRRGRNANPDAGDCIIAPGDLFVGPATICVR